VLKLVGFVRRFFMDGSRALSLDSSTKLRRLALARQ
jgi:hypothetical protein